MNRLRDFYEHNKKWLHFALIATFVWGMLAHAYCFFDNSISYDSLREFHAAIQGNEIKLSSGRILVPLYRALLRGDATLPWLIGALSLIWLGLTVFLILRLFCIKSRLLAFLTAGIFVVNISVSATAATFIHDLDCNMFSLLCAAGAVYLWREWKWGVLPGALLLATSMGIYQSFFFAAITLVIMLCIWDLLERRSFCDVFLHGMKAIGMALLAGGIYFVMLKVSVQITGIAISSGKYNSMDTILELTPALFLENVVGAYRYYFGMLLHAPSAYPGIWVKAATLLLLAVSAATIVIAMVRKDLGGTEKFLLLVLVLLLPLGMNMIYVLTLGCVHDLMVYPVWLTWLQVLLLSRWLSDRVRHRLFRWQRWLCMTLVALLLYGNVQYANGMYLKKDIEYDAYLSCMTRIVSRMEACDGYEPGQTPVLLLGLPRSLNAVAPGFKDFWNAVGMYSSDVIGLQLKDYYQAYFDYVLGVPLLQVEESAGHQVLQTDHFAQMGAYPAANCVDMIDGVLVVKLG